MDHLGARLGHMVVLISSDITIFVLTQTQYTAHKAWVVVGLLACILDLNYSRMQKCRHYNSAFGQHD